MDGAISLDALAADIIRRSGYRFEIASDDEGRETAFRLRYLAVIDQGWQPASTFPDGQERDEYDERAVHVVGWDGDAPIATGRLVLPPGPLPTEASFGITVEPRGRVIDVGRMTIVRSHQGPGHSAFLALLARLYLEVRARGYDVACGAMSARARSLIRLLGLEIELLGEDRMYWGELRAPVRFAVTISSTPLASRWT